VSTTPSTSPSSPNGTVNPDDCDGVR
jgi:hypothetical protein